MSYLNSLESVMFSVTTAVRKPGKGERLAVQTDEQFTLAEFVAKFPAWTRWAEVAATATKTNKAGAEVPWLGTKPLTFPNGTLADGSRVHLTVKRIA